MVTHLHVRAISNKSSSGWLQLGHQFYWCRLGRAGRTWRKREGDGKSPVGCYWLTQGFFRADRTVRIVSSFDLRPCSPKLGWCDAPNHPLYNRAINLPARMSHETLWREDHAYDVVITTDHNRRPRIHSGGSAIFFHMVSREAQATAGCIAVSSGDMLKILARCQRQTLLVIWPREGGPPTLRQKWHCQS